MEQRKVMFYSDAHLENMNTSLGDDDFDISVQNKRELEKLNWREYLKVFCMIAGIQILLILNIKIGNDMGLLYEGELAFIYSKIKIFFWIAYVLFFIVFFIQIYRRASRKERIFFKKKKINFDDFEHVEVEPVETFVLNEENESEKGFQETKIDEIITEIKEPFKVLMFNLGFFERELDNFLFFTMNKHVLTIKIPRLNRTERAKLENTIDYLESIFKLEIGAIYSDYEYFYIDYIVNLYVPTLDDAKRDDMYADKILYGYTYKGDPLYWDIYTMPNGIISSKNGQGKTVYERFLVYSMIQDFKNIKPTFIDGKGKAFKEFREKFAVYSATSEDKEFLGVVSRFRDEMEQRYKQFDELNIDEIKQVKDDARFPLRVLVIDEHSKIVDGIIDAKVLKKFNADLDMITKLGREAGFLVLTTLQQAHSRFISTDMRENAHFKAMMGISSENNYKLLFDTDGKGLKPLKVGQGYVLLEDVMTRFVFPKV